LFQKKEQQGFYAGWKIDNRSKMFEVNVLVVINQKLSFAIEKVDLDEDVIRETSCVCPSDVECAKGLSKRFKNVQLCF
jgi:hypothetical protein